jgi:hypothetical protein
MHNYDSGSIRIAFARGNKNLASATEVLDNTQLSAGVIFDLFKCRNKGMVPPKTAPSGYWGDDYHTYSVIWKPGKAFNRTQDNAKR